MADTENEKDFDDVREQHFEALFDGDEIDGKTYGLGDIVTGIDLPTAAYLQSIGRIAKLSDERVESEGLKKAPRKRATDDKANSGA